MPRTHTSFSFEVTPAAARAACHRIPATMRAWGVPVDEDLRSRLELVASELITNGVPHAGGRLTVAIALEQELLLIEVADDTTATPQPRTADPCDEDGRGLALVDALCLMYGSEPTSSGKRCWAVLSLQPSRADAAQPGDSASDDDGPDPARWSLTPAGARLLARLLVAEEQHAAQVRSRR